MYFKLKALGAAAVLVCSAAVQAEGAYVGGTFGAMNVDAKYADKNPLNAGIRGGYTWNSGLGIEAEFTGSASDGELDDGSDYSISTQALYATYRTQGDIYFKGRLGYLHEKVKAFREVSDDGFSAGIGAGFKLTENLSFEAEYTLVEQDVDYWSGSLVYHF
ncbi:porin family protein [Microbulbifer sp. 2205BS26-8]|uniref:porin family protein n=1 Tax=Microbulbifer sp. 2205BS26-8 TaxID=3064386 RepID=UPI00273FA455|nr:porin family protein [Microbulbifer sp. 2205BS26-8]MDP5211158.1 porin family protein [Microbulbifer sp. 2205BS26-8]